MVCGNFILPEPASYVFFYAFFNLRNLLYIIRQKQRVLPVTNVSLAVFPAESRASKTSALWRTGVTI